MKNIFLAFILFTNIMSAQERYTVSGTITDISNGETLFGASVFLEGTTIGVTTNEYGFYSITAPKGNYNMIISYIGFTELKKDITLDKDHKIDFEIVEFSTQLDEIVLTAEEPERAIQR